MFNSVAQVFECNNKIMQTQTKKKVSNPIIQGFLSIVCRKLVWMIKKPV